MNFSHLCTLPILKSIFKLKILDVSAVKSRFIVMAPLSIPFSRCYRQECSLHYVAIITVFVCADFEQRQPQVLNEILFAVMSPNSTNQPSHCRKFTEKSCAGTEMRTAEAQEKTLIFSFHYTNRFTHHLLTSAHWGLGSDWKPCRALLMNGMICKWKAVKLRKWGKYQKCISQAWRSKQCGTLHVVWVNRVLQWFYKLARRTILLSQSKTENPNDFIVLVDITPRFKGALMPHWPLILSIQSILIILSPPPILDLQRLSVGFEGPCTWHPTFAYTTYIRFQTQFQTRNCDLKLPRPQPVNVGEPSLSSCPTSQQQRIHEMSRENRSSRWACYWQAVYSNCSVQGLLPTDRWNPVVPKHLQKVIPGKFRNRD